jgi:hypothetical protein
MGIASVNRFIKELEGCSLIEIARRGHGLDPEAETRVIG